MTEEKNEKPIKETEATITEGETTHFYHPYQDSEEVIETLDEEEIEKTRTQIDTKLQELLKMINEETLQLSEFLVEEKNLASELCDLLRQILKRLKISFNVPAKVLSITTKPKQVIVNEEGHLILVFEKDKVSSKRLEEYPPEIIMEVIWNILPQLGKSIELYRKKISNRVSFFEKVKKELKALFKAFSSSETELNPEVEDAVKQALTNNKNDT
jgi:hypothetical protein